MKKALRYLLVTLLVVLVGALVWSYQSFNGYQPKQPAGVVDENNLHFFYDSYETCVESFLSESDRLARIFPGATQFDIPVPNQQGGFYKIDCLYLPATDTLINLLVLSGGIHGVEGFTGSAVQLMIMNQMITPERMAETGILLIHGINPYGFINNRRVTENNVDLNRNCDPSGAVYSSVNEGYRNLVDFINPEGNARPSSPANRFFYMKAIAKIVQASMPVLRQAVLQGQYEYPEGLYFGGKQTEPQISLLEPFLKTIPEKYQRIIHIDLHTGYGENGKLHLFPNPPKSDAIRAATESLFAGHDIDWGDGDDFYTITGEFTGLLGQFHPDKLVIPMTFEFGTLDSQTTMGSLVSIHNMILENQGHQHGYAREKSAQKVRERFREMYYPSSPLWRSLVIEQSRVMIEELFSRL